MKKKFSISGTNKAFIITSIILGLFLLKIRPAVSQEEIPPMGFGTWVDSAKTDPKEIEAPVRVALDKGYRHLDCAINYGNQKEVGKAIASFLKDNKGKVERKDLWVTSKYPGMPLDYKKLEEALDKTLQDMGLEYLDLFLIHHPSGNFSEDEVARAWKNMSALLASKKVRFIGVSNFYQNHMERLIKVSEKNDLPLPLVNQIEINPMAPETEMVDFCHSKGIGVTAYSPLGGLGSDFILQNDALVGVAEKLSATPAQVTLAWHLRRGLSVIPKSFTSKRIEENALALTLADKLSKEDMEKIQNSYDGLNYPTTICAQTFKEADERLKAEKEEDLE